jgi:predicted NBD/HSP70 family sugar kinase
VAKTRKPARRARRERCVLGIDVGGTNVRAGLFSEKSAAMHCLHTTCTEATLEGSESLARVGGLVREVVEQGRARGLTACKVGIGIPELIGLDGRIDSHCSLPWRANEVRSCLGAHGNVTIVSDVIAASLAEARMGAGRGHAAFLYVTVGTGISCALVIDGKPYAGAHGHAISFASGPTFAALSADGEPYFEPLEARASGPGILRRAKARGLTESDAVAVCRTALREPGIARTLIDEAATELAVHVAILANALDPTLVVLGGGLGCATGRYWSTFRAALPRHTWGPHMRRLRVRRAQLGSIAGTIGAALCAIETD